MKENTVDKKTVRPPTRMALAWSIDPYSLKPPIPVEQKGAFMMFACTVHGKTAYVQAGKCNRLFSQWHRDSDEVFGPLALMRRLSDDEVLQGLLDVRMGQYGRIVKAWRGLAGLSPPVTLEKLIAIPGIGPKTARFISMYVDGAQSPVLDVHVLRWLGRMGHNVPKSTPQDRREYNRVSALLAVEAVRRGMTVTELDGMLWNMAARKGKQ